MLRCHSFTPKAAFLLSFVSFLACAQQETQFGVGNVSSHDLKPLGCSLGTGTDVLGGPRLVPRARRSRAGAAELGLPCSSSPVSQ